MSASKMWPVSILAATVLAMGASIFSPALADPVVPAPMPAVVVDVVAPVINQVITFSSTAGCDLAPCRYQWRWYRSAGYDRLGTTMGEGEVLAYSFDTPGTKIVVLKVTNSGSTHGFVVAQEAVVVSDIPATDTTAPVDPATAVTTAPVDPATAVATAPVEPTAAAVPTSIVEPSVMAVPVAPMESIPPALG